MGFFQKQHPKKTTPIYIFASITEYHVCHRRRLGIGRIYPTQSKENVNPKPTFSYSSGGPKFGPSRSGTVSDDGNYYQSQVSLYPGVCGENQVTCRVNNIVLYTCQYMAIRFIYRSEFFGCWGK